MLFSGCGSWTFSAVPIATVNACWFESMENIRHFIWDFDGTLFDTYPVIIEDLNQALREFGRGCEPKQTMKLMLGRLAHAQKFYAEQYGIPMEDVVAAYERHHARSNRELRAQPMAGVREILETVCATGRHNYIFSHRKPAETADYLEKYGLSQFFTHVIGPGSEGFAEKPAPDAVLHLMKTYRMDPAETVMVGDRECDLGSGRNAGIRTAHLVCAAIPEKLNCDWRFESFAEMAALL